MNEQMIILTFLVIALAATLSLYLLKALRQVRYKGDERWGLIQLKANTVANIVNGGLIILLAVLPLFINSQTTFTFQRVTSFGLIYLGVRNLIELFAIVYFDRQL